MTKTELTEKYDVLCIGTALIDAIVQGFDPEPVSASGYRAQSCSLNVGGEAVNEVIALSKLGVNVGILCFLGTDMAGKMIESTLKQYGAGTDAIQWEKEHPTPITTMLVREDSSRSSITNPAHKYNFHPKKADIPKHASKVITLGSLFRAPFDDPEIIKEVLTAAKQHGLITVADTKLPNFRVLQLKDLSDSLPLIDYITPNEDEARYYTGKETPEEMAEVLLDHGVKNVILKLGRKGCYFRNQKESICLPAFDVRAIDSTGAGDNFIAGFVSEILRGSQVRDALIFASACGAICTTAAGAGTALVDRAQVMAFIDEMKMERTRKPARSSASEDRVGIAREDL